MNKPQRVKTAGLTHHSSIRFRELRNADVLVLAFILFLGPDLLFAFALRPAAGAVLGAGCIAAVVLFANRPALSPDALLAQPLRFGDLVISLGLACAILVLGGEGHFFFANSDWLWRDAVLADAARGRFPPLYETGGELYLLRAPLGLYMMPALVERAAGLAAGHLALLVQDTVILGLLLYGFTQLVGRRRWIAIVLILLAGGLDIIGAGLIAMKTDLSLSNIPSHIDGWSPQGQYTSTVSQLFWAVNHALPGWWMALVALLHARREITGGAFGLAMTTILFWSPLVFLGTLPFLLCGLWADRRTLVWSVRFWLQAAAALCFLPVALYLRIDAERVPHAFLLTSLAAVAIYVRFLILSLPQLVVVAKSWRDLEAPLRGLIKIAACVLIVLPLFQFGVNNDLVSRASIPALMIVAFVFARLVVAGPAGRPGLFRVAIIVAVLAAVTPAFEVARALIFPSYAISACNLLTVWQKLEPQTWLANYLARADRAQGWLLAPGAGDTPLRARTEVCWPGFPFDPKLFVGRYSNADLLRAAQTKGKY